MNSYPSTNFGETKLYIPLHRWNRFTYWSGNSIQLIPISALPYNYKQDDSVIIETQQSHNLQQ